MVEEGAVEVALLVAVVEEEACWLAAVAEVEVLLVVAVAEVAFWNEKTYNY